MNQTGTKREKHSVLFVDDEELIRSAGKRLLERLGYDVLLAGDGSEAIDVFNEFKSRISLVILDLTMPVMNGAEVFKKLKAIQPNVKVVISSGYSKDDNIDALLKDGAASFLEKPFNIQQLSNQLLEMLK